MQPEFFYNQLKFVRISQKPDNSTHGFFKPLKRGIKLFNLDKEIIAFVSTNGSQPFTVTAFKTELGVRYMYSMTATTEEFLKVTGKSYREQTDISVSAVREFEKEFAA